MSPSHRAVLARGEVLIVSDRPRVVPAVVGDKVNWAKTLEQLPALLVAQQRTAQAVYDHVTSRASQLVEVCQGIEAELGIPIVNKRISVTPVALVAEGNPVEIARALAAKPRLMLLDEPSEGVQPSIVQLICEALRAIRDELGTTLVFVEQNLDTILAIGERCYVMEKGRVTSEIPAGRISEESVRGQLLL